ncbi:MAG: Toxin SymE, type toxin-antitoxin system [Firmicutes bacterium]|nr:Toxin SymE, type toxin-antitoxin system [Bacillota bacterium]
MAPKDKERRILTVSYMYRGSERLPMIRLQGSWMKELGFSVGDRIRVSAKAGRIIIFLMTKVEGKDASQV